VIFEERWDTGEHFRSGCRWNIDKGNIFYFRPGRELYRVYRQELPARVIDNACR
jgi:trehalose utilization protein